MKLLVSQGLVKETSKGSDKYSSATELAKVSHTFTSDNQAMSSFRLFSELMSMDVDVSKIHSF